MKRIHIFSLTHFSRSYLITVALLLALAVLASCSSVELKPEPSKQEARQGASDKKQQFFVFMKPRVENENVRITLQREQLRSLHDKTSLSGRDQQWLQDLASEYALKLDQQPTAAQWQALELRVDVVPIEMALVQAANESAWGESRFAREGNNYFGQWCYTKGCGLVPRLRAAGASHEVRSFSDARESVSAYMKNINTSRAYTEFRQLRMAARDQQRPLDAEKLAMGLKSYSERGMAYVKTIQAMIRSNRELIAQS